MLPGILAREFVFSRDPKVCIQSLRAGYREGYRKTHEITSNYMGVPHGQSKW
jgi:hypothetical protein